MSTTTTAKGVFIWYELGTTDSKAAERFYSQVIGWKTRDMSGPNGSYTILHTPHADVGGLMELPAEARAVGAKPGWMAYIGVEDVDAVTARVKAMAGSILRAPQDIPTVGRFSVVADPHGAVFMLMTPISKEPQKTVPSNTPGHVGWRELHAGDRAAAWKFYSELFGWTKADAMDMGAQGVYQTFTTGGEPLGAMMTKMPQSPAAFWMLYFNVESLDAGLARVKASGGTTMFEPMQVPGGSWIVGCVDPQGAMFSLLSQKR